MITERDLREAIAECEGTRNPNANTCIKLAAFYTILEHLGNEDKSLEMIPGYSFTNSPEEKIKYSDSEFSHLVEEKGIEKCFSIIDELISTIYVMNPGLYRSFVKKLTDV